MTVDPHARHESARLGAMSVAVLLGGPSAEHDVSLVSGRAIADALARRGHAVQGWLIDLDGGWWRLPESALDLSLPQTAFDVPAELGGRGPARAADAVAELADTRTDVCFPALHGPFGSCRLLGAPGVESVQTGTTTASPPGSASTRPQEREEGVRSATS